MAREYVFVDEWDVRAPIEEVFEAVADIRAYPSGCTPGYLETEADGPPTVGRRSARHFEGRLPYRLRSKAATRPASESVAPT